MICPDKDAGVSLPSFVRVAWATITISVLPRLSTKGTRSEAISSAPVLSMAEKPLWGSFAALPRPGKCLMHAITFLECSPSMKDATIADTSCGSDPKDLFPSTGPWRSATGAKSSVNP